MIGRDSGDRAKQAQQQDPFFHQRESFGDQSKQATPSSVDMVNRGVRGETESGTGA
jgi:hypothetical protein